MNTFEMTIHPKIKGENAWPVVVKFKPDNGLTTQESGTLQLSSDDFDQLNLHETEGSVEAFKAYGTLLGKRLFKNKDMEGVKIAFTKARDASRDSLRIWLSIEADRLDEIKQLHWERLCVPEGDHWSHLALNPRLPFSFYIPVPATNNHRPYNIIGSQDLRALVLVASPKNSEKFKLAPFDVKATIEGVRSALGEIACDILANDNDIEGKQEDSSPNLKTLCDRLQNADRPYTLLHIVCHGRLTKKELKDAVAVVPTLYFATDDNQLEAVTEEKLLDALRGLGGKNELPHLIFLSSCESADPRAEGGLGGLAQSLIRELEIPAVIAMTGKVSIETALTLGQDFYQHLRKSGQVDLALQEATFHLRNRDDVIIPALFSRLEERPLFSDRLGRELTETEIRFGIEELEKLIEKRAPKAIKLKQEFQRLKELFPQNFRKPTDETKLNEQKQALGKLNQICEQVLEISFNALALRENSPEYADECPFPGLGSFAKKEYRRFFFGREELIKDLQKKLREDNFLAVLGSSGSGKSSLVLAGLIPQLEKIEEIVLADLTPGSEPVKALETKLSEVSGKSAVFVVDQFEELFTHCVDEEKRNFFIDKLLETAQNHKVIVTIRTDFFPECLRYSKLRQRIEEHQKLIGPMEVSELGVVIQKQANQVDLKFETGLIDAILAEVNDESGAMPLVQYALQILWERRRGRWLCYDEYREFGGVKQAIATTADEFYKKLSENEQKQTRHIFEQLIRVDEDFDAPDEEGQPKDTRRKVQLNQLVTESSNLEQTRNLVAKIANARLVNTDENEVEIIHEALIVNWPRLKTWLTESRNRLILQQQIRPTIKRWLSSQDDRELWRTESLQILAKELEEFPYAFNKDEKAFIQASLELPHRKPKLFTVLITSFTVAIIVTLVRLLRFMQIPEFAAYDQMMRQKPTVEAQDSRILIIVSDDKDIDNQSKHNEKGNGGLLKDDSLAKILEKLQEYQPRVIGLDMLRHFANQNKQLATLLGDNTRLIGVCTVAYNTKSESDKQRGYPVNILESKVPERVGFSDFIDDDFIRRQPLLNPVIDKDSCPTEKSFSFAIASSYLKTEKKANPYYPPARNSNHYIGDLKFGKTAFLRRTGLVEGYQGDWSEPPTYQVLLNYRGKPQNFAKKMNIEGFLKLDDQDSRQLIKDKIVIIGADNQYISDRYQTPYGEIAGVSIQAQMVSQIVSAVLDGRPLIWWWPFWADLLWIYIWSTVGGLIVWRFEQPKQFAIGVVSVVSLYGICYVVFAYYSGWIPIVPPILALFGTAGVVRYITFILRQGKLRKLNSRHL